MLWCESFRHAHMHAYTHTFVFTRSVYGQLVTAGGACTSSLVSISVSGVILNAYRYWGEIIHILDSVWCGIWESYSVLFVRVSNLGKSYESCNMLLLVLQYFMIPVYLNICKESSHTKIHVYMYICRAARHTRCWWGPTSPKHLSTVCLVCYVHTFLFSCIYRGTPLIKTPEMRTYRHLLLLYIGHPKKWCVSLTRCILLQS